MNSKPPTDAGATRLPRFAMAVGAVTASISTMPVTYGQTPAFDAGGVRGAAMTPQEQDFIFARVDAKVADLRGDIRLNTQGLAELKDRFNELAVKMAGVPADLAAMKRDIAHLPTKDELGNKLRLYLGTAALAVTFINAAIAWGPKLLGH